MEPFWLCASLSINIICKKNKKVNKKLIKPEGNKYASKIK